MHGGLCMVMFSCSNPPGAHLLLSPDVGRPSASTACPAAEPAAAPVPPPAVAVPPAAAVPVRTAPVPPPLCVAVPPDDAPVVAAPPDAAGTLPFVPVWPLSTGPAENSPLDGAPVSVTVVVVLLLSEGVIVTSTSWSAMIAMNGAYLAASEPERDEVGPVAMISSPLVGTRKRYDT